MSADDYHTLVLVNHIVIGVIEINTTLGYWFLQGNNGSQNVLTLTQYTAIYHCQKPLPSSYVLLCGSIIFLMY